MKEHSTLNITSDLTDQIFHKLTLEHIKHIDKMLDEVGEYGEVHIIVEHSQLRYVKKIKSYAISSRIEDEKNQVTSNKISNLSDQFLQKLTLEQIKYIDKTLEEVGEYGEVHIIVERSQLRYVNKLNSKAIYNLQASAAKHLANTPLIANNIANSRTAINDSSFFNNIEFNLSRSKLSEHLTPRLLSSTIGPYITAISQLQEIISEIKELKTHEVYIKSISQNSPISVSLDGASDAIQTIQNIVTPWRNTHIKELASLLEREKILDIECKKAEILEKHALAEKSRNEAKKISAEVDKQRVEIDRMKLENEKIKIELHREKIKLALETLEYISPNLSESEKISFVVKILQPLEILIASDITISSLEKK